MSQDPLGSSDGTAPFADDDLMLDVPDFEHKILVPLCANLNDQLKTGEKFGSSSNFETEVRTSLQPIIELYGGNVELEPPKQGFPDIVLGQYGIEVKFTEQDTWRSIANSISQGTKSENVRHVYVVFAKMGGKVAINWARYEDAVIHVRTSHVPRFEIELFPERMPESRVTLFDQMGISYAEFSDLPMAGKMEYVRDYARGRLKQGDQLWWIEDNPDGGHSLPLEVRLYTNLEDAERRQLRAEAALLCPEIVGSSRDTTKYQRVAMYLITYHGVVCTARDLYSAGSVAGPERGGNYVLRSLAQIEHEMRTAADYLEDALFVEYWGESVPKDQRIARWLERADIIASEENPSDHLFLEELPK